MAEAEAMVVRMRYEISEHQKNFFSFRGREVRVEYEEKSDPRLGFFFGEAKCSGGGLFSVA
jgi:hypothetical protein